MVPFERMTAEDVAALRHMCAPERVRVGEDISEDYAHDELAGIRRMPEALVEP